MIKHISTIGIVLMTTLVVYRATTIDHSIELEGIYQRGADVFFDQENSNRLNTVDLKPIETKLLAFNSKKVSPNLKRFVEKFHNNNSNNAAITTVNNTINTAENSNVEQPINLALSKNNTASPILNPENLSLDRESTINSNLSLLFPRQRILQHPSQNGLGE